MPDPESRPTASGRGRAAGLLLGVGLGGFLDGIVLHQVLQWHHLLSSEGSHPTGTVAGLEANTLADGLFHLATWLAVAAGLWLLVRADPAERPAGRALLGLMLVGWGAFNLVEGLVDHQLLGLHHVKEGDDEAVFDIAFLLLGALLVAVGSRLARAERDPRARENAFPPGGTG